MNTHYLQHVAFEGLGSIEPWLCAHDADINRTRFFAGETLPRPEDPDLLIVLGGPMGVNDVDRYPWLESERRFVLQVVERGTPVLGICLGAQVIASALGAHVYRNPEREIGWFPVSAGAGVETSHFAFPQSFDAFHWHGDTFHLPDGAIHLAESEACTHQAFSVGDSVLALQFHLETTPESARLLVDNCREELNPSTFVQDEAKILGTPTELYSRVNSLMAQLLDTITGFT